MHLLLLTDVCVASVLITSDNNGSIVVTFIRANSHQHPAMKSRYVSELK